MRRAVRLRWLFYLNLSVVVLIGGYKLHLMLTDRKAEAVHVNQVERIEERLARRDDFSFAVVGNINNSIGIFERKIIPMLNESGVDFVISAGNAVSIGGEDKYKALYGSLSRLQVPYLLTFGDNEHKRFGGTHFYNYFGPYLYAFSAGNSRFIFLDSTGKTAFAWQLRWLEEELRAAREPNVFVFLGHALRPVDAKGLFGADDYLLPADARGRLTRLIEKYQVDAVFSANLPRYAQQKHRGTEYIVTGGAGGLVLNNERSFYHYVRVSVREGNLDISPVRLDIGQHPLFRTLESLWFFVHSLFYVGYANFLLLVSAFCALAIWIYSTIFTERDYYPDFDVDPELFLGKSLRVAMFTNNFLPFIGGVPISISHLRKGLTALGHQVLIVAPSYQSEDKPDEGVLRLPCLLHLDRKKAFPIANPFCRSLYGTIWGYRPDVIHLHHPIWLGTVGQFIGRRLKVPVVYTYHTRLEHYSHFVPLPGALFRNLICHTLIKRFANRCDAVVVPTDSAEDYLRMIGVRRPTFVLPTGIEYERFANAAPNEVAKLRNRLGLGEEKVLVSVSRLSKEKNIDFMLDALRGLAQKPMCSFKLLIVGEGAEREYLVERVHRLGLSNRVVFAGAVSPTEMPLYYALGDVFVFASRSETQGMVLLEAMAAGLPVVAVRSSGTDDIVKDGVNGYKTLLNQKLWRQKVETLLIDAELRRSLSVQAREFAKNYRIESFAEQMVRVYAHVLSVREKARQPKGIAGLTKLGASKP